MSVVDDVRISVVDVEVVVDATVPVESVSVVEDVGTVSVSEVALNVDTDLVGDGANLELNERDFELVLIGAEETDWLESLRVVADETCVPIDVDVETDWLLVEDKPP